MPPLWHAMLANGHLVRGFQLVPCGRCTQSRYLSIIYIYYLLLLHVGNIYTNYSAADLDGVSNPAWRPLYNRIWDVTDIIVPPVENNAFFITTNIVITPNQARGECAELGTVAPCRTDTDCPAGRAASNLGSGVNTGVCNTTTGSCQVYAWCPLGETWIRYFKRVIFFMHCFQHCFICRSSESTVSEDAGIEPRTVATSGIDCQTL